MQGRLSLQEGVQPTCWVAEPQHFQACWQCWLGPGLAQLLSKVAREPIAIGPMYGELLEGRQVTKA